MIPWTLVKVDSITLEQINVNKDKTSDIQPDSLNQLGTITKLHLTKDLPIK